jgi:HSP20 family protein
MGHRYSSVVAVSRLQGELNRLFQELVESLQAGLDPTAWRPSIDVVETADSILVLAEVPGVAAADVRVEVEGNLLSIAGSKTPRRPRAGSPRFQLVESGHGTFFKQVQLLHPVNSHRGTARLVDGLLTIEFPKVHDKRSQPRRLAIEELAETRDEPRGDAR